MCALVCLLALLGKGGSKGNSVLLHYSLLHLFISVSFLSFLFSFLKSFQASLEFTEG
jgi:hypothetical protein